MKIRNSSFLRDGVTLVSGNVWAQAIAFVSYLVLSRLFSPGDFGLYNIFFSYIEVLVIVSTCKYEQAIVLADTDREATAVSRLSLRLNTVISIVLLTVLLLFSLLGRTAAFADTRIASLNPMLALLVPPMVFFCGTSRVYSLTLNRFRKFRHIAFSEVVGSTSGVVFKVLFGLPRLAATLLHTIGLPLGTVLGKTCSNINLAYKFRRLGLPRDITRNERREAAAKFRNFPLFTMPKDLINSLSYNLPFLWLALYFDKTEVGLFSLALTCTFRPINLFNNVFEKLLYVRIAEKVRAHQTIRGDIRRFILILNAVVFPLFVVVFIFGDGIFGFLFGSRWTDCGFYLRCLLPWVLVSLTSTSLMFIANVFSRQRTEFFFYIALFLLRIAAMLVGLQTGSFRLAILLFAASGAVVSMALLIWYVALVRRYENSEAC
ncbi:MAG: oligosaccharide flippase family protein [Bacteroidales bacterium]|nr:oligosaccharide flippase family protein [Bacteroidales bacterium]